MFAFVSHCSRSLATAPVRIGALAALGLGLEYGRVLLARQAGWGMAALLGGGLALCLMAYGSSPHRLGLGRDRLAARVLGGFALAAILLVPAAVRWQGGPSLGWAWSVGAMAVSVGEELAFRGVLFAALKEVSGGWAAVLGTTAVWTAAHALSHPPAFLLAVGGAGLLLGTWRLVCGDLLGPIVGHVLADLAL
jgi:membrane protease YdiL (CAAX protease family)